MIKVYVKYAEGVCFTATLRDKEILRVTLGIDQERAIDTIRSSVTKKEDLEVYMQSSKQVSSLFGALKELYDGKDTTYCFLLADTHLPSYSQRVLSAVSAIPKGYITSYGAVAKAVGGGARAVGNVMAANPFPLIIPCHRVVKSDWGLGGYGAGGLGVKLELLKREQQNYSEPKEIKTNPGVLKVFPTEIVLKKYC
ncbi:MAG: methylated-DNA--[protein]-cysteine S-methyltransferase [Candidatus Bathyarchaeota archaeon]|nr:methylated-DNA--[protein]-cysteine S-methyltransferase [Candidatus Termitimicrobium sp.]